MKVRQPFWYFVGILSLLGISAFLTGSDFLYRLAYLTIVVIIFSWIWAFFSVRGFAIQRWSRGARQQLGQVFEEQYEVRNRFRFSRPWVEISDGSSLPGAGGAGRVLSWIKSRGSRAFTNYNLLVQRGEFNLGPTVLSSGDLFGLFENRFEVASTKRLLILPYIVDISSFPLPSGLLPGGLATRRRTPERTPPNVSGVREYSPGDPLNRIHWRSSARRDKWLVKEFEEDPQADVWILLNAFSDAHSKQDPNSSDRALEQIPLWWLQKVVFSLPADSFEYAITLAGSIAKYMTRSGKVVGFSSIAQKYFVLAAERGERQLSKILEALTFLKCEGKLDLEGFVKSHVKQIPKGSTVVVITPTADPSVISSIAMLIRQDMKIVLLLLESASFGGNQQNDVDVDQMKMWGITTVSIKNGDNIKNVLETTLAY